MKKLLVLLLLLTIPLHAATLQQTKDAVEAVLTPLWTDTIRPAQEAYLAEHSGYFQGLLYMDLSALPNNPDDASPVLTYAQMVEVVAGAAIPNGTKIFTIAQQPPDGWGFVLRLRDDANVISAGTLTAVGTRDGIPGQSKDIDLTQGSRLVIDRKQRWTQIDSLTSTGVVRSAPGPALVLYAVRSGLYHPGDQDAAWEDFIPEWPELNLPCALWIDAYNSPNGPGYVAHVVVRWNSRFWHRAKGHGPEDRDVPWEEIQ